MLLSAFQFVDQTNIILLVLLFWWHEFIRVYDIGIERHHLNVTLYDYADLVCGHYHSFSESCSDAYADLNIQKFLMFILCPVCDPFCYVHEY